MLDSISARVLVLILFMHLPKPIFRKHRGYTGARLEQMKKAASLGLEGATIPEIAEELNVSESTVRRLLKASEGLPTRYLSETARVARLMELERMDRILGEFFPVAIGMDRGVPFDEALSAAHLILDILHRRMKLLRYEDSPPINIREIHAFVTRFLGCTTPADLHTDRSKLRGSTVNPGSVLLNQ